MNQWTGLSSSRDGYDSVPLVRNPLSLAAIAAAYDVTDEQKRLMAQQHTAEESFVSHSYQDDSVFVERSDDEEWWDSVSPRPEYTEEREPDAGLLPDESSANRVSGPVRSRLQAMIQEVQAAVREDANRLRTKVAGDSKRRMSNSDGSAKQKSVGKYPAKVSKRGSSRNQPMRYLTGRRKFNSMPEGVNLRNYVRQNPHMADPLDSITSTTRSRSRTSRSKTKHRKKSSGRKGRKTSRSKSSSKLKSFRGRRHSIDKPAEDLQAIRKRALEETARTLLGPSARSPLVGNPPPLVRRKSKKEMFQSIMSSVRRFIRRKRGHSKKAKPKRGRSRGKRSSKPSSSQPRRAATLQAKSLHMKTEADTSSTDVRRSNFHDGVDVDSEYMDQQRRSSRIRDYIKRAQSLTPAAAEGIRPTLPKHWTGPSLSSAGLEMEVDFSMTDLNEHELPAPVPAPLSEPQGWDKISVPTGFVTYNKLRVLFKQLLYWLPDYALDVIFEYYRTSIFEFTELGTLGQGRFGTVYLAERRSDNQILALKTMEKADLINNVTDLMHVKAERTVLEKTSLHGSLLTLLEAFEDPHRLYLALEYTPGGDFMNFLMEYDMLSEEQARPYLAEMAHSINAIHSLGFMHRDVAPDNFLVDGSGHLQLSDFNLCRSVNDTEVKDVVGTPDYIAPEVLSQTGYGKQIDWWSFGVILYETLCGSSPFFAEETVEVCRNVVNWQDTFEFPNDVVLSDDVKDLMLHLICSPEDRYNFEQIKAHPWFKGVSWDTLRDQPASLSAPVTSIGAVTGAMHQLGSHSDEDVWKAHPKSFNDWGGLLC